MKRSATALDADTLGHTVFGPYLNDYRNAANESEAEEIKQKILDIKYDRFSFDLFKDPDQKESLIFFNALETEDEAIIFHEYFNKYIKDNYPENWQLLADLVTEILTKNSKLHENLVVNLFKTTEKPVCHIAIEKILEQNFELEKLLTLPPEILDDEDLAESFYRTIDSEKAQQLLLSTKRISSQVFKTSQVMKEIRERKLTQDSLSQYLKDGIDEKALFLWCCKKNQNEGVDLLFKAGFKDMEYIKYGWNTILFPGTLDIFKVFIKVFIKNKATMSQLFNRSPIYELLSMPMDMCCEPLEKIDLLLNSGLDLNLNQVEKISGESALSLSLSKNEEIAWKLIKQPGIDVAVPDNKPIQLAIFQDKLELAEALYEKGASLTADFVEVYLNQMIYNNFNTKDLGRKVKLLMKLGASFSDVCIDFVVSKKDQKIIQLMLENGVAQGKIFTSAARKGVWSLIYPMLNQGFKPTQQEAHTALLAAISQGNKSGVSCLVGTGIDFDFNRSEALINAVLPKDANPKPKLVQLLLDCGASPRAKGCQLPFMALSEYNHTYNQNYVEIAKMLVEPFVEDKSWVPTIFNQYQWDNKALKIMIQDAIGNNLPAVERLAFNMLRMQDDLNAGSNESSMDAELREMANKHFKEVIKPALQNTFEAYPGESPLAKITSIEQEIRGYILDVLRENAKNDPQLKELRKFIKTNRAQLMLAQDKSLMAQMRLYVNSNTDNAHIAWRAYDEDAPVVEWNNLLTGESLDAIRVRERVAYYFIAKPKPSRENFLQQLADIRRAHEVHLPPDNPSCPPGAIARIGKMGEGHDLLGLPPSRKEVIRLKANSIILRKFSQLLAQRNENERKNLFLSLTMLTTGSAEDIIIGKAKYDEAWLSLRSLFRDSLGTVNEIINEIDEALQARGLHVLTTQDKLFVENEFTDIGGQGRSAELYKRYQPETSDEELAIKNPYVVSPQMLPAESTVPATKRAIMKQMYKKMRSFIEFELLYPFLREQVHATVPGAVITMLTQEIIDNVFDENPRASRDDIALCAVQVLTRDQHKLFLSDQRLAELNTLVFKKITQSLEDADIKFIKEALDTHILTKENSDFNQKMEDLFQEICEGLRAQSTSVTKIDSVLPI